jgi:hypothetical protein
VKTFALKRFATTGLAVLLAAGIGVIGGTISSATSTPQAAHAASTAGGVISRSEVLSRAQSWVDEGIVYSPNAPTTYTYTDDANGHYRDDCSGLVSMAWHLTSNPVTGDFQNGAGPNHALTSLNDLKPGDAIVRTGHIELFVGWGTYNGSHGAFVYSFNTQNETVENPYANTNFGSRGFNNDADMATYTPIRYDNIVDDVSAQASGSVVFNGTLYEFGRGADGTVKYWYANGGPWSSVQTFGSGIASDPVATVFNGTLYVYAIGTDGSIKYWYANGGPWSSMQTFGSSVSGALSSTVFNGTMYVFARGTDGSVKYWFANGGPWSSAQTIGGTISGAISSAVFNGYLYVFAIGTDGSIKYWFANGGPWSSMQTFGSAASGGLSSTVFNSTLYVFARGTDGSIKYWFANGGPWSSAQTIGGTISGAVSSTVFNSTLYVFARGTDGSIKYWFANGGPWSSMQTFGGGLA